MDSNNSKAAAELLSDLIAARLSRRAVLKRGAALGLSIPVVSALLVACGDDDDVDDDEDVVAAPEDDDDTEPEVEPEDDDTEPEPDDDDEEPVVEEDDDDDDDEDPVAPVDGGVVNLVMPQLASDPTTMSPLFTRSGAEQAVCILHYGGLLKMDETMTPVHDLVDSWEITDDALHLRFELLPDANWSDGEPVSADDVIFTFERAANPETGSTRSAMPLQVLGAQEYAQGDVDSIEGLSAPDSKSVEIELADPNAIWALQLTALCGQGILPKHVFEDIAPAELEGHELSRNPEVGAGAFLLARWETEQFLEFRANETYFKGRPSLDGIVMKFLVADVALAQLETGETDLANVTFDEYERVQGLPELEVVSNPSVSITQLMVNNSREHLTPRIKQAFMHAIDHVGITSAVYHGLATPVFSSVIGPSEWLGDIGDIIDEAGLNTYDYDPDLAMQILEEEGWDPEQPVELIYVTDMLDELPAWTIIQENLRAAGVRLELTQLEFATMRSVREDGEYDLIVLRGGIPAVDPGTALTGFIPQPDGSDNLIRYSNERLTEIVAEATRTADTEVRRELYLEAAQIQNEELPHLFLWSPHIIFAHTPRLSGFLTPGHFSNIVFNADEWTLADA
jgi:ABC-type transport system substrate-binding protein